MTREENPHIKRYGIPEQDLLEVVAQYAGFNRTKFEAQRNEILKPGRITRSYEGSGVIMGGCLFEVKLETDKYIIFQSIRYYKMVNRYKHLIAKENPKIDPNQPIKVILISEDYNEDTKDIVGLLDLDINLYTYSALQDEVTEEIDVIFNETSIRLLRYFLGIGRPTPMNHFNLNPPCTVYTITQIHR